MTDLNDLRDAARHVYLDQGDVALEDLAALGFDEVTLARHGQAAIAAGRRTGIDQKVMEECS